MASEPDSSKMRVLQEDPFNASPSLERLIESRVTPNEHFFVRNHAPAPRVSAADHRLRLSGQVERPGHWSPAELRERFPRVQVEATLQCAGNRREDLIRVAPIPGEVAWGHEAVGNAVWEGSSLAALLREAGVRPGASDVEFIGLDRIEKPGETVSFGGSVPLEKALDGDVLLADTMNGRPLSADHGFPLRAVVPGYIGARSVKWLQEIRVADRPSENFYQARSYKLFPSATGPGDVDWSRGLMLGELSVNSVICRPTEGATVAAGSVRVAGYATAGGNRTVERVHLSADDGRTWQVARLSAGGRWSWRLWEADLGLAPGPQRLAVRAWDSASNTQPENPAGLWNFKGYMNNAWHRVAFVVS